MPLEQHENFEGYYYETKLLLPYSSSLVDALLLPGIGVVLS